MWVPKQCYEDLQERASQENFIKMLIKSSKDLAELDKKQHIYLLEELVKTQKQLCDLQLEHNKLLQEIKGKKVKK